MLNQSVVNRLTERDILIEGLRVLKILPSTNIQRLKPPFPDFKITSNKTKKYTLVEVTQIMEGNAQQVTKNITFRKLFQEIQQEVKNILRKKKIPYGHISVYIFPLKTPKVTQKTLIVQELTNFIIGTLNNPKKSYWTKELPHHLSFIEYLNVVQSKGKGVNNQVVIFENQQISLERLEERVSEKIKEKELKNYKNYLKAGEKLWLIIRVDDSLSTTEDILNLPMKFKSEVFDKIFVQGIYSPETGSYPLKRVK